MNIELMKQQSIFIFILSILAGTANVFNAVMGYFHKETGFIIQSLSGENVKAKIRSGISAEFILLVPGLLQAQGMNFVLDDMVLLKCAELDSGRILIDKRVEKNKEIEKVLCIEVAEIHVTRFQDQTRRYADKLKVLTPAITRWPLKAMRISTSHSFIRSRLKAQQFTFPIGKSNRKVYKTKVLYCSAQNKFGNPFMAALLSYGAQSCGTSSELLHAL